MGSGELRAGLFFANASQEAASESKTTAPELQIYNTLLGCPAATMAFEMKRGPGCRHGDVVNADCVEPCPACLWLQAPQTFTCMQRLAEGFLPSKWYCVGDLFDRTLLMSLLGSKGRLLHGGDESPTS